MGRLFADAVKLLPKMVAARKMVEPGTVVGGSELARMSGMTWRILRHRIESDPAFPVIERGSDGVAWQFDAAAALDRLIATARATAEARTNGRARTARLAGLGGPGPAEKPKRKGKAKAVDPEPGIPADLPGAAADMAQEARGIKALAEAQMLVFKLKVQQGEYVRADQVAALLTDIMATMQVETLGITTRLDKAGKWPPDLRAARDKELRTVLLHLQTKVDAAIVDGRVVLD